MLIKRRTSHHPTEQDVTPETVYQDRRRILKGLGLGVGAATLAFPVKASLLDLFAPDKPATVAPPDPRHPCRDPARGIDPHPGGEGHHPQQFLRAGDRQGGPGPQRPLPQARALDPEGGRREVAKPFTLDVWDLINKSTLEERIYRLRCVEAWSMVLPWSGIALADLIRRAEPTSRAKFVAFETLYDPEQLPGQASRALGAASIIPMWRACASTRPCTPLLPRHGALWQDPARPERGSHPAGGALEVRLQEHQEHRLHPPGGGDAPTTWNLLAPTNMASTPTSTRTWITRAGARRASVSSARGIFGAKRQPTLMFNGYGDEVASLYQGMDLRKWY